MKMLIVNVSNSDSDKLLRTLAYKQFYATKISSYGMFLKEGNTTICICVTDSQVTAVREIIKKCVTKRTIKAENVMRTAQDGLLAQPVNVEENGAVMFLINVSEFSKI